MRTGLRIAWIGPVPGEDSGVPGVATDLLQGLARLGHQIDCFFPESRRDLPERISAIDNLQFVWSSTGWEWDRWYSRSRIGAFGTSLLSRARGFLKLRQEVARRHSLQPYDLIYQFSNIETLSIPRQLRATVPLVIHPETHVAGELRWMLADRRLNLRCQRLYVFLFVTTVMSLRSAVQFFTIRQASLLVCISEVFRDHMVRDYRFPVDNTVVIPNPVRSERFALDRTEPDHRPTVLVLGRIALRKGIETVVEVARQLAREGSNISVRIVGGPSLWSDYTPLLDSLPSNAFYAGQVTAADIPDEMHSSDILLQASKYEPFALTVAEALAAGLPVVASAEVGAIEQVDCRVGVKTAVGDAAAMAAAVTSLVAEVQAHRSEMQELARAEAIRLFDPETVCLKISAALEALVVERSASRGGQ